MSQRFVDGEALREVEWLALRSDIKRWRARLTSISWYMRIVNERIARQANAEDHCTGRFWEGRFKSQALLDERARLSCMAYVDLNPIRAKMAKTPESPDYTSIKHRISTLQKNKPTRGCLETFDGIHQNSTGIPFKLDDYVELVDWSGRIIRDDKRGAINSNLPPIIERLGLEADHWKILTTEFEEQFKHWVGSEHIVRQVCEDKAYQRIPSINANRRLLG